MHPQLRMHKPNATIILKIVVNKIRKMIPKFERKSFPLVCRACRVKSIDI